MRLIEITQYDTRPGHMTEWRLHETTIAAAAQAPQDHRPPSHIQDAHIRTTAALRQIGIQAPTWLAAGFDVAGELNAAAMEQALTQWTTRHETLRSQLKLENHELKRFTLSADQMKLDPVAIDDFTDSAEMLRYLEERFDAAADPLTWPPYIFVTVEHEDAFTVYLAFDHTNVDGYSIVQTPQEIQELYAAAVAGRPADLPEAGSYLDFSKLEFDATADVDADHDAVAAWREFVDVSGGSAPQFPLDLGVAPGEMPRQTSDISWLLSDDEAAAFDAACKAAGASFNAGVLATASAVAYELGDEETYRSIIPLHTRTEPRWQASLGWYIGLAPVEIPTAEATDFVELVRMARGASRAVKPLAQVPFAKIAGLLDAPVRPLSVISYIDMRSAPGAREWEQTNATAFGKVSYGDEVYMWIHRTFEGAYMAFRYPTTDVADKNVAAFIERFREILLTVAETGNYTLTRGGADALDSPDDVVAEAPRFQLRREPVAQVGGRA